MSTTVDRAPTGVAGRVTPMATRAAERADCEFVQVTYGCEAGRWILRVIIDHADGIDVEKCARVSRELSSLLDVEDVVPGAYTLEVSSPGLDRELVVADDYRRFAGRRVRLRPASRHQGRRIIRGTLRGIEGETVRLEDESGDLLELPLAQVAEARLEYDI